MHVFFREVLVYFCYFSGEMTWITLQFLHITYSLAMFTIPVVIYLEGEGGGGLSPLLYVTVNIAQVKRYCITKNRR